MTRTKNDLIMLQALPLEVKVRMTESRIREWVREYGTSGVSVSFSGGKDSTVLLHIVRNLYPDVEAVFVNTGLEYPEIQQFVKTFDNVTILRPKMRFDEVLKTYAERSYYGGFNGQEKWKKDVDEACKMGAEALRELDAKEKQNNKPMTNGDKIRTMCDEELAWELMIWRCEALARHHGDESQYPNTQSTILAWLQQPAEPPKEEHHAE